MNKIVIDKYDIETKKTNKKLLVISDIHFSSKKDLKRLNKLLDYLKDYKCDYIIIPGDFLNNAIVDDEDIFITFLTDLSKIAKIVISIGNHDTLLLNKNRMYYKNEELFKKISDIKNVVLLDNEVLEEAGIRFVGLTLPNDYYNYRENENYFMRYINNVFEEPPTNLYNIILCHSPLCIQDRIIKDVNLFNNANLIISGHTHSAITPRFLRNKLNGRGIITPYKAFFPKTNNYGLIDLKDKKLVISSGILKFSSNTIFRYFNFLFDTEMIELNLYKKKKSQD